MGRSFLCLSPFNATSGITRLVTASTGCLRPRRRRPFVFICCCWRPFHLLKPISNSNTVALSMKPRTRIKCADEVLCIPTCETVKREWLCQSAAETVTCCEVRHTYVHTIYNIYKNTCINALTKNRLQSKIQRGKHKANNIKISVYKVMYKSGLWFM